MEEPGRTCANIAANVHHSVRGPPCGERSRSSVAIGACLGMVSEDLHINFDVGSGAVPDPQQEAQVRLLPCPRRMHLDAPTLLAAFGGDLLLLLATVCELLLRDLAWA